MCCILVCLNISISICSYEEYDKSISYRGLWSEGKILGVWWLKSLYEVKLKLVVRFRNFILALNANYAVSLKPQFIWDCGWIVIDNIQNFKMTWIQKICMAKTSNEIMHSKYCAVIICTLFIRFLYLFGWQILNNSERCKNFFFNFYWFLTFDFVAPLKRL